MFLIILSCSSIFTLSIYILCISYVVIFFCVNASINRPSVQATANILLHSLYVEDAGVFETIRHSFIHLSTSLHVICLKIDTQIVRHTGRHKN